jgi:hypothetical protein
MLVSFGQSLLTLFELLAAYEFHEFGLCHVPVLVSTVVYAAARLVDLISAGPYLVF